MQLGSLRAMLLPMTVVMVFGGCTPEIGRLRREIVSASAASQTESTSLDLSRLVDGRILKLCIQNQYMIEDSFVELTQMESPGFRHVAEGEFVLWIYIEGKPPMQLHFRKKDISPQVAGSLCTESPVLRVSRGAFDFN
jgi:hypothetical protein